FIAVNTTDNYVLEVNLEGCIVYDTIVVTAMPPFIPDLGPDRDICPDEVMTLSANYSGMGTYLWSTGEVTSDIEVSEPGTYHVTVVSEYQCVGSDTVVLSLYPLPIVSLGQDTTVC